VTRRSGLGRGLDALIPPTEPDVSAGPAHSGALRLLAVDDIAPNPRQPRTSFDPEAIAELARSISELGVLQPLLVRSAAGGYELVAGERRLRAARAAGLERVPAVVTETDETGALERALVENIHREDLNPIEEAAAFRQLLDEGGLTQDALAQRVARSRSTIANSLRLLELPVAVQRLLVEGRLSAAHGKALLALGVSPFQERLARRAAHEGFSVRETEDMVRRYQAMAGPREATSEPASTRPAIASEAQRALADYLGARVRVEVGKRKGRVVIDFASLDELERLLSIILGDAPGGRPTTIHLD
jgi:ParB family transcriptional regulator, chromosome partitioning protein